MSSTNRANRAGMDADYFLTPVETIADFLREFAQDDHEGRFAINCNMNAWHKAKKRTVAIFDPAAGGDELNEPSYPLAMAKQEVGPAALLPRVFTPYTMTTLDIRPDSRAMIKGDYLQHRFMEKARPDVIMTNPPFNLAQAFIEKALRDVKPFGMVVMLLRLNFFGSQSRFEFWQRNMPFVTYVHCIRPSFWPEQVSPAMLEWCKRNDVAAKRHGATDSIEYMHCVWQAGWKPRHTLMRVI